MGEAGATEVTASAIISYVEKLESDSSQFYRKMAERFAKDKETFLSFAKEDDRTKIMVVRTYQETITDAIEACFSFKGLILSNYTLETTLYEKFSYIDALKTAIKLEEKAIKFYTDVAKCSGQLLATIPSAFQKAAETRNRRILKLKSLLESKK
jgi:rubrerythrin